jgi:hypothetical protein
MNQIFQKKSSKKLEKAVDDVVTVFGELQRSQNKLNEVGVEIPRLQIVAKDLENLSLQPSWS